MHDNDRRGDAQPPLGGAGGETAQLDVAAIAVPPKRLRELQPDKIEALAADMAACGQLQEIIVRPRGSERFWLVAGLHRFEAAKQLNWQSIRCLIVDMDADHAELAEIAENLVRAELTPAETALHAARYKQLYEQLHPAAKHGGDRTSTAASGQSGQVASFAADTAKKTGRSERSIRRAALRGQQGKDWLSQIVGTSLDQGTEIDALLALPDHERDRLIAQARKGERVSVVLNKLQQLHQQSPSQRSMERKQARRIHRDKQTNDFVEAIHTLNFAPKHAGEFIRDIDRKLAVADFLTKQRIDRAAAFLTAVARKWKDEPH